MANLEQYANNISGTLASAMTSSTLFMSLSSATGFPTSGNFRVAIDSELIEVTNIAGVTCNVLRGTEGTTAATHAMGATVYVVLTAAGLQHVDPLFPNNQALFDTNSNLLAPTGAVLADAAGNIYNPGAGIPFIDGSGNLYYPDGSLFVDVSDFIYYGGTNSVFLNSGGLFYESGGQLADILGNLYIPDSNNLILGSTNGSSIGSAITQKLSFYGATPITQRTNAAQAAVATTTPTNVAPYGYTLAQATAILSLLNEIRTALVTLGLIKGS